MNPNPNDTDALLEIIRKELNTIVEKGSEQKLETSRDKKQPKPSNDQNKGPIAKDGTVSLTKSSDSKHDKAQLIGEKNKSATEAPVLSRTKAGETMDLKTPIENDNEDEKKLTEMQSKFKSSLEKDIANQTAFLNSPRTRNIDADLQKMQIELQDSYNLFKGISEKFESINFHNLHKRIKELNLSKKRDAVGTARAEELKEVVEEGFKTNRMKELTTKVGEKFDKHPGEFGNIPELSSFFQACTQLEHVLGTLNRQHSDVRNLEERMRKSAEISYSRVSHIKEQLKEIKSEKPTRMDDFNNI